MNLKSIFFTPDKILRKQLRLELRNQGHHNTGALEASFTSEVTQNGDVVKLEGYALDYGGILNDGTRPEKASMSQFPFVKNFFLSKGVPDKKAGAYAAMTIKKWMQEGMSTKASARFSKTGKRLGFIGIVEENIGEKLDSAVFHELDKIINEEFYKSKSETI